MTLTASFPTEDVSGNPIDDTRRIFGGMVAAAADGTPRLGVIDPDPSTPIVTGTTSMAYLIKGDETFVTQRDSSTGGVELSANDAVASVATTTAPVANSRIDVIWIKCQFDAYGDSGLYTPTFGVTQGTAASSPTKPSIPAGALELATAVVTSSDVTTETVVITNTVPFTAMAGGVVRVRDLSDLTLWEPSDGSFAVRLDTDVLYQRVGGAWKPINGAEQSFTPSFSGITVGNGSSAAAYWYVGAGLIHVRAFVKFGSTSAVTGTVKMTLPVNAAMLTGSYEAGITAQVINPGQFFGLLGAPIVSATELEVLAISTGGSTAGYTPLSSSVPGTWDTDAVLTLAGTYKAA